MLILTDGTGKNQLEPGHERMGDAKPTSVLEHCLEGGANC
jgi:hypothetical protein